MPKHLFFRCRAQWLAALVLVFSMVGCVPGHFDDRETWVVSGPLGQVIAGGETKSVFIKLKNLNATESYRITPSLVGAPPAGWTVTNSGVAVLPRGLNEEVAVEFTITVPAGATLGDRVLKFHFTDEHGVTLEWLLTVTVSAVPLDTKIEETIPFAQNGAKVFESGLKVSNGTSSAITTLVEARALGFFLDLDAVIWFSPKSGGIVVDSGTTGNAVCRALPRTNLTSRTFNLENYINHLAIEYKYPTSFSVSAATDVAYTVKALDYFMGVSMGDGDKTTTYEVEFDPILVGHAGQYTFTIQGLNAAQYTATVNPPIAALNAAGDPVTVTVTITRTGSGSGETTDEFTLRATHDHAAVMNTNLMLPIRTYVGRP